MKLRFFAISILALSLMSAYALKAETDIKNCKYKIKCIEENNGFAIDLYSKLSTDEKEKGKNIFFSPFSISDALAMTFAGARGNTEKQMAKVLHFSLPQQELHPAFSSLIKDINGKAKKPYKLKTANALWGQKDYHFLESFIKLIDKYYDGGFFKVDFIKKNEMARKKINKWVEDKTENKIKDLIAKRDINFLTRLVLTNAIYFKGNWASKFKEKDTKPAPFYISEDKIVKVPMMFQEGKFPYMERQDLQMLELPYTGDDLSMVIFLPGKNTGIKMLEQDLTAAKIKDLISKMQKRKAMVYLPKFKIKTKYYLKNILHSMGMPDAFSSAADFSGMTGDKDLKISKVIHQAYVDVNEEGTEAAAATAVVMAPKSMPKLPPVFRVDHPFIFMIVHKGTGSILFMGKIVDPTEGSMAGV
ncbi:MAG: serpin family protein [Deltaproteobacteria bacterium]|nr:serpin family protein [Deltaproteobacteria bacterium]